jgi:hypothetical protein
MVGINCYCVFVSSYGIIISIYVVFDTLTSYTFVVL